MRAWRIGSSLRRKGTRWRSSRCRIPRRRSDSPASSRIERLPPEAQLFSLLAAAEPVGDPALLWRAAAALGLTSDAAAPAEADGLLRIGGGGKVFPPPGGTA